MDKDLERRIEERKNEAYRLNIYEKANEIVMFLGVETKITREVNYKVYRFYRKPFSIEVAGPSAYVNYNRSLVYEKNSSEVLCYIPGKWQKEFESLYVEAQKVAHVGRVEAVETVAREQRRKEGDLKRRFGL